MKITRAAAGLLLLALVLGAQADSKCANCGLGEGHDACNHGNIGVVAQKLAKPDFFVSPEIIKNAIKRKSRKPAPSIRVNPTYSVPTNTHSAPTPSHSAPAASPTYGAPASSYSAPGSAYSAPLPTSSTYTATPPTPPPSLPPFRSKGYVQTARKNDTGSYDNEVKHIKDDEDLQNLLNLKPGFSIAPKFEPIGDGNNVIGVIPAYPGKLPCKCPKPESESESEPKPTSTPAPPITNPTPAPQPAYSIPGPSYIAGASSYSAPTPSYSAPFPSYSAKFPSHSAPVPPYSAPVPLYSASATSHSASSSLYNAPASSYPPPAPTYSAPTSFHSNLASPTSATSAVPAEYAPAYKTAAAASYSPPLTPSTPAPTLAPAHYTSTRSAPAPSYSAPTPPYNIATSSCGAPASLYSSPTAPAQYASAYQNPAPEPYSAPPSTPAPTPVPTQAPAQYAPAYQQSVPVIYIIGGAAPSSAKKITNRAKSQSDCNKDKGKRQLTTNELAVAAALSQYAPAYQQPAPASYATEQTSSVTYANAPTSVTYTIIPESQDKKPYETSKHPPDHYKDEQEAQTLVEIKLQNEQTPIYIADPVSIALAFKSFADSQSKKHVIEDSLAYGHYKEPVDGRVSKHVSNFDEEKLHTFDKPVVELKCGECGSSDCQNLHISYDTLGYGPIAPSKNRFVLKTDDTSDSPCGPAIIYVPPPEDKSSLPCGPLGPTIPGYKPGRVILGDSDAKPTCGCCGEQASVQEGSRQINLIGCKCQNSDSEEYESGRSKGGIIERIKSSSCSCRQSEYK